MAEKMDLKSYILGQVMRLSGLPGFPRAPEGIRELVDICEKRAKDSRDRVKLVIDECVDGAVCPTPMGLKDVWFGRFPPPPREACWQCRNVPGWIIGVDYAGNSTARRCPCGAIQTFREPTPAECENMRPMTGRAKAEFEAANEAWFKRAMDANKARSRAFGPSIPANWTDPEELREREAIQAEGA